MFPSKKITATAEANNPVVVRSSGEFDALFGRKMMGLSLDKAWVPHHTGRQQLKGAVALGPWESWENHGKTHGKTRKS